MIKTGGKQYKVAANDTIKIEKIDGAPGDVVTFDQVLMVGDGDDVTVGAPLVEGASVAAHFVSTDKQRTVIILKKQRRQHFDRRNGHRQRLSTVRIGEILTGGKKPTLTPDERLQARAAKAAETATAVSAPKAKPAAKAAPKKAATKPAAEAAPAVVDDLKLISGVGPALEKKLHDNGVTSLSQVAAWGPDDIASFDEKLSFHGRIEREDWIGQAKDLLDGKPPRAKKAAKADKE